MIAFQLGIGKQTNWMKNKPFFNKCYSILHDDDDWKDFFDFHPTCFVCPFPSRVELMLFKNWFVFHTNGLFAHSQLSRMKDALKIGVVENLFKN